MTGLTVATDRLTHTYGSTHALADVSLELGAGRIHGLLGRNGAGKTTLLSLIASMLKPTSGEVTVDSRLAYEDETVTEQVCLIRESGDVVSDEKISMTLDIHETLRPGFSRTLAEQVLAEFGVRPKAKPGALSRGQRSAVGIALGLASKAPVTMFDEVHLGLDAPSRQRFADLLLAEFAESGRTIILSTHLISEVEHLLETVTILHEGRVLVSGEAEDLRSQGVTVTGPADIVESATRGLPVVAGRSLGPTREVTLFGASASEHAADLECAGLTVTGVPLQDLFIHLTAPESSDSPVAKEKVS
ncbi:MAG: ABC transporter ATP-binding protein [Actinomycetia bacterium]|nr:ABC transporter ATP-binding protein [Actinomycetes bacterium]